MLDTIKNEDFLAPEELAKKLKLSLSSIYKLVRSGELPSIRLGKVYRIPESDLLQFLRRQKMMRSAGGLVPKAARQFVDLLESSPLKERTKELYLYGSYARGDFDRDSDIDLCLIMDRLDTKTRNQISSLAEQAMAATDYQELLSIKEETHDSWQEMKRERYPLVQNILREGISIWKSRQQ